MEDAPDLESWLGEHLGLDLTVDLADTFLDVELVRSSTAGSAHDEVACIILPAGELSRDILELEMPLLLLFDTLLVGSESGKEILTLAYFLVSVCVDDLSKILHQPEVSSHNICHARKLTEFWDQSDLVTGLAVFVDQEWLVWVRDGFVVPSLVVLGVAHLSAILVKCALWTHAEVDALHSVGLLVVSGDYSATDESLVNGRLPITTAFLSFVSQGGDVTEDGVSSDYSEGDVDIEERASLFHDEPSIEAGPHLDVVSSQSMSCSGIEGLGSDGLESETSHHGVEEDLKEVEMITIGGFHDLNPLDGDLVLGALVLSFIHWQVGALAERVHTGGPVDEELKFLLDLVSHRPEHQLAELPGVVGDLRLELDGVLVDALDLLLVEVDLEVVGVELELSAWGLWGSLRLFRE